MTDAGPDSKPWHSDGVHFRCKGPECGDCCSGKKGSGYVWVSETEMRAIATQLGLEICQFTTKYVRQVGNRYSLIEKSNQDCIFYIKDKGCGVYDARPTQCRTYPFWPEVVRTPESWALEALQCPGIDKEEPRVPGEEVAKQLVIDAKRFSMHRE
ncbi:MAG: YkgJ family cysteine cluster protein [Planctomycetes bacterium]|nr:YkgJ family cysteine cluster protein [Planctomycetota bacterium]